MSSFSVFHYFERVNKGELKMVNINYLKLTVSLYFHFIKIIKGPGTSFQSSALNQKHVRNVRYMIHYHSDST